MLNLKRKNKGQSTLEYAILVVIIIGALIAVQTYIKRGIQGKMKSSSDDIGDQYSPGNTNITKTVTTNSSTKELFGLDASGVPNQGVSSSTFLSPEITNTVSNSSIINVEQEYWGK